MRRPGIRIAAVIVSFALGAAACGSDRDESSSSTAPPATTAAPATETSEAGTDTTAATETSAATDSTEAGTDTTAATEETTAPTEAPESDLPMFGDAPWPCGPGDGANTDDGSTPGVTADSIAIAGGDDAGYAGAPGLSAEMTDAMKAAVSTCNDLGGINGRQITFNYYDAKLFDVGPAMQAACDDGNFFMVGEGWAFDSNQEEIRLACDLPAVPGYSVSAAFAHGKDVYSGVPGPSDETTAPMYPQFAALFPETVSSVAALVGAFSATQESRDRAIAASEQFGYTWVSKTIEYNPVGEADWTPLVKQIQDSGAKLLYWSGSCLPNLQLFAQSAVANGLDIPIITDSNHYAENCTDANTDGALDNVYMRMAFVPFEEADVNPATQDYLDMMADKGGKIALLGAQATSSFLLWATAASACGASLTRECALENLANTHSWTGHGLHAEGDPGGNHPPSCGMLLKISGDQYERVTPTERGTFECDPAWVVPIDTAALAAAKLDANRISQQFATGG